MDTLHIALIEIASDRAVGIYFVAAGNRLMKSARNSILR